MSTRHPLPIKVSVLGTELGQDRTPEEAIEATRRLLQRSHEDALGEGDQLFYVLPLSPPRSRMNDGDKIKYFYEHGRWPTPHEQDGWYA